MPILTSNIENAAGDGYDAASGVTVVVSANVTILASAVGLAAFHANVYNYGTIISTTDLLNASGVAIGGAFNLVNGESASIEGYVGVDTFSFSGSIINHGHIDGRRDGIRFANDPPHAKLTNTGTITGMNEAAVYAEGGSAGSTLSINNSGVLDGSTYAFLDAGSTDDTIRNTGVMNGDVQLGDGTNVFNGRGGTVNGTILGGSGADTIYAGNDGETLGGGAGRDKLYGGAGSDTFVFKSYLTADADRIYGFDPAHDLIQLDHTVFTKLAVDSVPTFANAATASGTTDFLYYNAASGYLYYDADGSGTRSVAHAFANLGTGLQLSASNFQIV